MKKIIITGFLIFSLPVFSQEKKEEPKDAPGEVTLTIEKAVYMVLEKNLTLQSSKYDILMTDTELQNYLSKYSINLNGDLSYSDNKMPVSGLAETFGGNQTTEFDTTLSISKLFSTGTLLQAGIKETLYDQNDQPISQFGITANPPYHKPSLFISVQQELLRNAFGYGDRKNLEILTNTAEIKKEALLFQLSGLIVSALIDYWQVIIEEYNLKNSQKAHEATVEIRDIVSRNTKFGLADSFELNQYQSLVAASDSRLAMSEFNRDKALRKLLRTVNLPEGTKIKGVTDLREDLPELNLEESLKVAFEKRTDYQNLIKEIQINELSLALAHNNELPSMRAYFTFSAMGQSDVFGTAATDVFSFTYPSWKAGIMVTYPLFDTATKTGVRNAEYKLEQSRIKLEDLKKEITNEVTEKYKAVLLQYQIMQNTKSVLRESNLYYEKIMQNAKRGRFNSIVVKNALDSIIDARQKVLEALVQYNISLLQFDLSKNEVFERYNINLKELMKNM